jgi:hypothetical protein
MLIKMISKCMLCSVVYNERRVQVSEGTRNISHGYCPICFEILMEEDFSHLATREEDENTYGED